MMPTTLAERIESASPGGGATGTANISTADSRSRGTRARRQEVLHPKRARADIIRCSAGRGNRTMLVQTAALAGMPRKNCNAWEFSTKFSTDSVNGVVKRNVE